MHWTFACVAIPRDLEGFFLYCGAQVAV